jgi:hypothetical protein
MHSVNKIQKHANEKGNELLAYTCFPWQNVKSWIVVAMFMIARLQRFSSTADVTVDYRIYSGQQSASVTQGQITLMHTFCPSNSAPGNT